ncbi:hypothetical protein BUALT_Bualt07G0004500 [Buddleja alternifolia]|uniref:Speckle-type POZ protein n=1 Tax=Buddleja alternifolia TaxID=168488 RepID=A0AAV6X718_9LAMI|nr:hypothetical protein BUALT_Bualt07G0004500 [Buddleja alternifolia]
MATDEASESASLTVRRMVKGSYEFVVENYSVCKGGIGVDEAMESEEFTVGGYRWTVCFYPSGMTVDAYNAGYASLLISLKGEATTYVRFLYDLFLLDQSGKGKHWGRSLINAPLEVLPSLYHGGQRGGYYNFIKRELLEPSSDYLKDDCLKVTCTIGVLSSNIQNLPLIKVPKSNIGTCFGKLLENKKGADVFFDVSGETFCAHRWILAAGAPVFRSHLSEAHRTKEIVIPDIEPRIFKALLWFIYTGALLEEEQEAFDDSGPLIFNSFIGKMFAAADRFALKNLKNLCVSHILERVSVESVAYLLHLAERYHATELIDACLSFAAENRAAVMESEGSEYLKEACPLLFLELAGYSEKPCTSIERVRRTLFQQQNCIYCEGVFCVYLAMVGKCFEAQDKGSLGPSSWPFVDDFLLSMEYRVVKVGYDSVVRRLSQEELHSLFKTNTQESRKLQPKAMAYSSSSLTVRTSDGVHDFVVENYSLCKGIGVKKELESTHFSVGGHPWTILFYPDGITEEVHKNGDASLLVCLKSKDSKFVRAHVELKLLDQSGNENHYCRSLFKDGDHTLPSLGYGTGWGCLNFINLASLESSEYLKDDCLKIQCSIRVFSSRTKELCDIEVPKPSIGSDFGELLESKRGADVVFEVGGERFVAHKWILAAAGSPIFRSHFVEARNHEMIVGDVECGVFKAILWFIYTGTLMEEEQEALDDCGESIFHSFKGKILAAAHQFELTRLKKIVESQLLGRVSVASVAYLLHLAHTYDARDLKAACLRFSVDNQAALQELDAIHYLQENCPLLFLDLYKNEEDPQAGLPAHRRKDVLTTVKEYFASIYQPLNASSRKRKRE